MLNEAAKILAAGLATISLIGAGVGIGTVIGEIIPANSTYFPAPTAAPPPNGEPTPALAGLAKVGWRGRSDRRTRGCAGRQCGVQ